MASIEAQDIMPGKTYSDGKRVFKVRRVVALGRCGTQVVKVGGGILSMRNTDKVFDSANDIK